MKVAPGQTVGFTDMAIKSLKVAPEHTVQMKDGEYRLLVRQYRKLHDRAKAPEQTVKGKDEEVYQLMKDLEESVVGDFELSSRAGSEETSRTWWYLWMSAACRGRRCTGTV